MSKEDLEPTPRAKATDADEVIHAPRGSKRGRFILAFLLAMLVLTTFSVSSEVVAFFTGKAGLGRTWMSYTVPGKDPSSLSESEFVNTKRSLAKMRDLTSTQRTDDPTDEETATFIVLDAAAQASGIEVTDKELGDEILKTFGTAEMYKDRLRAFRNTPSKEFEETLRRQKRLERYLMLTASAVTVADPAEVERLWKGRHQEYAFDYVELPTESLKDAARAQVPPVEDLEKWFNALSEPEKNKYKTQDQARAEVVFRSLGPGVTAEDLIAKYKPTLPTLDPEARARDYYEGFRHVRFNNPDYVPTQGNFDIEKLYKPFDEVHDQCLVEAEIYACMEAWITDMQARLDKGDVADMLNEGQGFRFGVHNEAHLAPRSQWSVDNVPGWGRMVAETLFSPELEKGKLNPHVVVEKNAFVVLRLVDRELAHLPEFAAIQNQVQEDWIAKKAQDLAVAKIEALRDLLGTRPPETDPARASWHPEAEAEAFAKVVQDIDLKVEKRDFQERIVPMKPGETPTPTQTFFMQSGALYTLREKSVAKAEASRDGKFAYLVRIAGVRDGDIAKMTPGDFQTFGSQALRQQVSDFQMHVFGSKDFLKEHYGVHLKSWDKEESAGS